MLIKKGTIMSKPIVLAICGKSASGKDSLAKWLYRDLTYRNVPVNKIISHTTRPPREGETVTDYKFISTIDFLHNAANIKYLEYTQFRGWYYGTPSDSILENKINIGVFNVDGIKSLMKHRDDYEIIPIYLEEKLSVRLLRSHDRENKWKIEFFRRALVDFKDFRDIKYYLKQFENSFYLKNETGVLRQSAIIERFLVSKGYVQDDSTN